MNNRYIRISFHYYLLWFLLTDIFYWFRVKKVTLFVFSTTRVVIFSFLLPFKKCCFAFLSLCVLLFNKFFAIWCLGSQTYSPHLLNYLAPSLTQLPLRWPFIMHKSVRRCICLIVWCKTWHIQKGVTNFLFIYKLKAYFKLRIFRENSNLPQD